MFSAPDVRRGATVVIGLLTVVLAFAGDAIPAANGSVGMTPQPKCPGVGGPANHVVGTPEDDELVGTPGDDVICGFAGDDTINGKGGTTSSSAARGRT